MFILTSQLQMAQLTSSTCSSLLCSCQVGIWEAGAVQLGGGPRGGGQRGRHPSHNRGPPAAVGRAGDGTLVPARDGAVQQGNLSFIPRGVFRGGKGGITPTLDSQIITNSALAQA